MTLPKRVVLESWGTLWCCHIFFTDWEALTWFLHTLTLVVLLIREARMLSIVTYYIYAYRSFADKRLEVWLDMAHAEGNNC